MYTHLPILPTTIIVVPYVLVLKIQVTSLNIGHMAIFVNY